MFSCIPILFLKSSHKEYVNEDMKMGSLEFQIKVTISTFNTGPVSTYPQVMAQDVLF